MPRIPSDFLDVGFTDDLQKTIASNINIMLHYWMIYASASLNPSLFQSKFVTRAFYPWMNQTNLESNRYLKSDTFLDSFSEYVTSLIKLHSMTRGLSYPVTAMSSLLDKYSASAISRVLLEIQETPHEVVYKLDDVRLMHYLDLLNEKKAIKHNAPIVIVYAPVNSYHIMDIRRGRSIVEHFVSAGFDVYLIDWGRQLNNKPSLSAYVNYLHRSIEQVKKLTHSKQVSILGYSWGGVLSMIYASLRAENVKNLILQSAHVDFDKDTSILASWFRRLPLDDIVREFNSIDCRFVNLALLMRNPAVHSFDALRFGGYMSKGSLFYSQLGTDAMRIAAWMSDTPMIPAGFFRDYIGKLYQQNQLVKNELQITLCSEDKAEFVDLAQITMPLLNIVDDKDDICTTPAATPINDIAASEDKELINFPIGHIELSVSSDAHVKLWPRVVRWLEERSPL
ncbi:MAG: alpha/beta fold hydrolase [Thermoproteota archaeon]|nr:alpha/beta fold hydrolase [Thermoproteota archaeon]